MKAGSASAAAAVALLFTASLGAGIAAGASPRAASPAAATAHAAMPALYKNCTALHRKYPHGLGRANAVDRVRGDTEPVTTFKRSTRLYNLAMSYNKGLDRDKDGVACEQA